MKLLKMFFSLYIGLVIYIVFSIFFGNGGIFDYNSLSDYHKTLEANLEKLKNINQELYEKLISFNSNPETIRIYSRELGYFKSNERVIKYDGFSPIKLFYKVGTILKRNYTRKINNYSFLAAGLVGFLLTLGLMIGFPFIKTLIKKKKVYGS
jgi:cell division protein FtsB